MAADPTDDPQAPGPGLRLLIETERGVVLREVPHPRALPHEGDVGPEAEREVRTTAADLGLPDFVYEAGQVQRGNGTREVGDALIICGDVGLSVQVKARTSLSAVEETERSRVQALILRGLNQAAGTVRQLHRDPVRLRNLRGRSLTVDGRVIRWTNVVILDHPSPPPLEVAPSEGAVGHVVLIRRDWEFLFSQLRSVHAVIAYLERVAEEPDVLGAEPHRYYDLAQADEVAPTAPTDEPTPPHAHRLGYPRLPIRPQSADAFASDAAVRLLIDQLASLVVPDEEEERRLATLAVLDRIPVSYRTALGLEVARQIDTVTSAGPHVIEFRFRIIRDDSSRAMFVVGAAGRAGPQTEVVFRERTAVHHQRLWSVEARRRDADTVGVLVTPEGGDSRNFATSFVHYSGDLGIPESELMAAEAQWEAMAGEPPPGRLGQSPQSP